MIRFATLDAKRAWSKHRDRWNGCVACPIGLAACRHVLGRGSLPCDILFVGEAPGPSEDASGLPFVGRAGKTLETQLRAVRKHVGPFRYFVANALACFPEHPSENTFRPPTKEELDRCLPRLYEVLKQAKPKGVVFLGKVSESLHKKLLLPPFDSTPWVGAYHPSYVNRKGGPRSLVGKRTLLGLKKFIASVLEPPF